ncbi:MAG TPA: AI-2E family transporter [Candidatus Acidoferrales bacterium]|jgi:predicted PurR-regulated permease PerM|nr:AI-2E family transporter [Candidatus Acidoferrales bacterium]
MTPHSTAASRSEASRERLNTILLYASVLLLGYLVYLIFLPFLVPIGWAGILAVVLHPWHQRLTRRMGETRAAILSTSGVTLLLIVPTLALATLFVREAVQAALGIQHSFARGEMPWASNAWAWLVSHSPGGSGRDLSSLLDQAGERIGTEATAMLSTVLTHTALFFFDLFITIFALFYFFRDGEGLLGAIRGGLPFEEEHAEKIIKGAERLIRATVTTSLVVAAIQGILCGIGFAVVGIGAAVFWGVGMAFCSLLPVIGSALIWLPATVWLLATGHWGKAIVLVAICAGLTTGVDSLLRPLLLSGQTRMNALMVFVSLLGGVAVFGPIGLVLGPILVAMAVGVVKAYAASRAAA